MPHQEGWQLRETMADNDKNDSGEVQIPAAEAERQRQAEEAFERGIIERGEAAPVDQSGKLPPGVTHEIVGHDSAGRPILKRRRFSAY
jgi:hypothetical protein